MLHFLTVISIIALILSISGNVLVNYKKKSGFIVWSLSNVAWIGVNLIGIPNISQIIMYCIYLGLNIHGYMKWKLEKNSRERR